jgi:hypothetical protein
MVGGGTNWTYWRFGRSAHCCDQAYEAGIGCDQVRLGLTYYLLVFSPSKTWKFCVLIDVTRTTLCRNEERL